MNGATPAWRLALAWLAAGVLSVGFAFVFLANDGGDGSVGPNTYSRSAIGHAGVAELLRRRGVAVVVSRADSLHRAGPADLLVVAEPEVRFAIDRAQRALLEARDVLLVLPKWQGVADRDHAGWIGTAEPLPEPVAQMVLEAAVPGARVVRAAEVPSWSVNEIGAPPRPVPLVQLVASERLRPLVGTGEGMLLGLRRAGAQRLWVLADPDVISNQGLGRGNAAFAVALFDTLRAGGGVVFDETIHGFAAPPPNPLALLADHRFMLVGLEVLAALGLALWAGGARFGAVAAAEMPLKAGKRDLVRNIARLFEAGGHHGTVTRRYVEETLREVAGRLHMPPRLDAEARRAWLSRAGSARGVGIDAGGLEADAAGLAGGRSPARLLALAGRAWEWKQEMLHGTARSARPGGGHPRRDPQAGGGTG